MIGLEFIGYDRAPAPRLKDVISDLSQARIIKLYWSIMRVLRTLYIGAGLVHGDLSEYNLYTSTRSFISSTWANLFM